MFWTTAFCRGFVGNEGMLSLHMPTARIGKVCAQRAKQISIDREQVLWQAAARQSPVRGTADSLAFCTKTAAASPAAFHDSLPRLLIGGKPETSCNCCRQNTVMYESCEQFSRQESYGAADGTAPTFIFFMFSFRMPSTS